MRRLEALGTVYFLPADMRWRFLRGHGREKVNCPPVSRARHPGTVSERSEEAVSGIHSVAGRVSEWVPDIFRSAALAQNSGMTRAGNAKHSLHNSFTNPPWPMGTPATPTVQTVGAWGDQALVGAGDSLLFPARISAATAAAFLREESKLSPGFREAAHA